MDKNNKCYNLIREQVECHKKYPGNEYILDEIIDDVYSHSEVIMNSISNEKVIAAYLQKVITTSIITVSKEMKRGNATIPVPQVEQVLPQVTAAKEVKIESVKNDLVEKMINNTYDELSQTEETKKGIAPEEVEVSYDTLDELDLIAEEPQEQIFEEDSISLPEESEEIQDETITPELETFEKIQEEVEPNESLDTIDEIQEVKPEENLGLELENEEQDESIETLEEALEDTHEDTLEFFEEVPEVETAEDFVVIDNIQDTEMEEVSEIDELDSNIVEPVFTDEVLEEITPQNFELEETDTNIIDIDSPDNILSSDFTDEDNLLQTEESLEGSVQKNLPLEGKQPDFSVFNFTPKDSDDEFLDTVLTQEDIQNSLETLDIRNPELKIKQVYKLKYEKGKTVSKIAKELDISEDDVIAGLTELVGLI